MRQMDAVKIEGLAFLTLVLLLSVPGTHRSQAAEPIKIGAVLALTGWAGFLGTQEMQAIVVEVEKVNRQGGILGRPLEVYFEDDQSNPTNSAIAATKLIRDKKVCCLIGSTLTVLCMPMLPIVEQEQILNISIGAGQEITMPLRKWVFRIPATDKFVSEVILKYAVNTLGARKIAILYSSDASGVQAAKAVQENIGKYNATIVIIESYDPKDTTVIPQLTKIKAARPDVLILNTTAGPATVVAKNYHQLGMEVQVLPGQGVVHPEFLKLAGKFVEGKPWIFRTAWSAVAEKFPPDYPLRVKVYDPFIKALREKYGKIEYSTFHGNGYDAIHILMNALKIAGTDDRAALRNAMEKVEHEGLIGNYKYSATDHDGLDDRTTIPMIAKDGEFWPLK
jgi:branched-chain amino acid transport system substrate-binding protein